MDGQTQSYYPQALPAGYGPVGNSHVAVPVITRTGKLIRGNTELETAEDLGMMGVDAATQVAVSGLKGVGGAAAGVGGAAVNAVSTRMKTGREADKLVQEFAPEIAQKMGVPVEQVDEQMLRDAAEKFPEYEGLRDAFETFDQQNNRSPVKAGLGAGAALAATAAVAAPAAAVLGPAALVGELAAGGVAGFGADKLVETVIGKDEKEGIYTLLKRMEENLANGTPITAKDMFAFHVAADAKLAEQIKGKMGGDFMDLSEKKQETAMGHHPKLYALSAFEAEKLNAGEKTPLDLMNSNAQIQLRRQFEALYPKHNLMPGAVHQGTLQPRVAIAQQQPGAFSQALMQERTRSQTLPPDQPTV